MVRRARGSPSTPELSFTVNGEVRDARCGVRLREGPAMQEDMEVHRFHLLVGEIMIFMRLSVRRT